MGNLDDTIDLSDEKRSSIQKSVENEVCAIDEFLINHLEGDEVIPSSNPIETVNDKDYEKTKMKKDLIQYAICILAAILLALVLRTYVMEMIDVEGSSMESTLSNGNFLILDKITYRFTDPERFDIIVFEPDFFDDNTLYIKRIIGLPGETIQIIDGDIYINGELLEEDYGMEEMKRAGRAKEKIVLGKDEYFVLGDNRNHSTDSRSDTVANVNRKYIRGKAFIRLWPLNKITMINHQ